MNRRGFFAGLLAVVFAPKEWLFRKRTPYKVGVDLAAWPSASATTYTMNRNGVFVISSSYGNAWETIVQERIVT